MAGALAVWACWVWGQGIAWSPDSMCYGAVAESLLAGDGLHTAVHRRDLVVPYPVETRWPPGFPLILAGVAAVVGSLDRAATVLCGLAFVGVATGAAALAGRLAGVRHAVWAVPAFVVFAPLLLVTQRVWSEGPTWLLWIARTAVLIPVFAAGGRRGDRSALGAGLLAGTLVLFRHAMLVSAVLTPLFVAAHDRRRGALAAAGVLLTTGPWVVASLVLSGRFGASYPPPVDGLGEVVALTIHAVGLSFAYSLWPEHLAHPWVAGAASFVMVGALVAALVGSARSAPSKPIRGVERLIAAEAVGGLALFVWMRSRHYLDGPDLRTLLPFTLPLLVLAVAGLLRTAAASRVRAAGIAGWVWAAVLGGVFLWSPVAPAYLFWQRGTQAAMTAWVGEHATAADLVIGPAAWVHHQAHGVPVLSSHGPPYGVPFDPGELRAWRDVWPADGRVLLLLPARSRSDGFLGKLGRGEPVEPLPGVDLLELDHAERFRVLAVERAPAISPPGR